MRDEPRGAFSQQDGEIAHIHLLRELKGRAVIVAINQTVRALRAAGVQPDVVLACDYQNLAYHFEGVQAGEIPALGLGASVSPELFGVPADRVFTYAASPILESWIYEMLGESASLPAGGTVSITAMHLALRMGCTPVVTIGLDLALAGRKYYADNAADGGRELAASPDGSSLTMSTFDSKVRLSVPGEEQRYREALAQKLNLVEVPGFFGQPVQTTANMRRQILALRAQLAGLSGQARFVNATEGGAFIEGMEHRPLSELVELSRSCRVEAPRKLAAALTAPDVPGRRKRMRERLDSMCEDLRRAVALAARCRKSMRNQGSADSRAVEKLQSVARRLPFLSVLLTAELCEVDRAAGEQKTTLAELDSAEAALYGTLEREGAKLLSMIEQALESLSAR